MIKLVLLLFIVFIPSVFADVSLPAIGQDSHYQLQKEQEIGRRFYNRLLRANKIVSDPLVNFYLKEVTSILLQSLNKNYRRFDVSIINDSSINAFAVPGGYIGINYGLVFAAQTEAQLAGVLAHEISHIVLRHLSQLLKKQDATNNVLIASILLALVVSQASDSDSKGEAVEALVFGGKAGAYQALINFTRENEYEADRKGLELMKKSGYPAIGMAEFFSILEGEGGSSDVASIEYLRTHPVSANRMGEAYQLKAKQSIVNDEVSIEFELFKVYLNSLIKGDYKTLSTHPVAVLYEQALKFVEFSEYTQAKIILQKLYKENKENIWVIYALIKLYTHQNLYDKALLLTENALGVYPQQALLVSQKIDILVLLKQYDEALLLALKELEKNIDNQAVRFGLVGIYEQLNLESKARETEGDYMLRQGNIARARYLYQLVLKELQDKRAKQGVIEKIAKIEQLEKQSKEQED